MSLTSGARIGAYEVVVPIGSGGMGEVWKARDARLARDVAIKVLPDGVAADADRLRRFEQEAQAAAALNHPNILAVYDVGSLDRRPYIVSEASRSLRRDRELAFYGAEDLTPSDFYKRKDATEARDAGRMVVRLVRPHVVTNR